MRTKVGFAALLLGLGIFLSGNVGAAEKNSAMTPAQQRAQYMKIIKKYKDSLITVDVLTTISQGGRMGEQHIPLTGTVIDKSGLVLVTNTRADPGRAISIKYMGRVKAKSTVRSAEYVLPGGKKIPAEIAIQQFKFDILIFRPTAKTSYKFKPVKLVTNAKLEPLTPIFSFTYMGKSKSLGIFPGIINLALKVHGVKGLKPYTILYPSTESYAGLPAFTMNGDCIGVYLHNHPSFEARSKFIMPAKIIKKAMKDIPKKDSTKKKGK